MKTPKKTPRPRKTIRKMDPVVHFEFPAEDRTRMAKFYTRAFGWKTRMLGKQHSGYVLATTSETDKKGWPKKSGMINGGFFKKDDKKPAQYPSVVIAVDDIELAMNKIRKAGGEVIGEPIEIPGFGLYVSFYDTERNRISIMEPNMG
jgi:predicted enzyme related to lactoylglutathione lyase